MTIRILFIGDSWQGSSARSMREALATQTGVILSDIGQDHYLPLYRSLPLRIGNRVLRALQVLELEAAVLRNVEIFRPDVVLVYKGSGIRASLIKAIERAGPAAVNIFPDLSPHAHGRELKEAIGAYSLVISTKPVHPAVWRSTYGYCNPCVCVPHGYDPHVHLWVERPITQHFDVALCSTWRSEYHELMRSFGIALNDSGISVAIAGSGWARHRHDLPAHWHFLEPRTGRAYGEFLRSAKIALAPVTRHMVVGDVRQPAEEDTTRSYELAAAYCFFLHQRTNYVRSIYSESDEVPMWSDAFELATLVRRWLPDDNGRHAMAAKAHSRAVPNYSIPARAVSVLEHLRLLVVTRRAALGSG